MSSTINQTIMVMLLLFISTDASEDKPTLAVWKVKGEMVNSLETTVITNSMRMYFVNTSKYLVLDRENMDKLLQEQSMPQYGVTREMDAARLGRLLNVEKIVFGSLLRFNGEYFLQASIVDVQTSTIETSCTERFSSQSEFPDVTRRVTERLTNTQLIVVEEIVPPPSSNADTVSPIDEDNKDMVYYRLHEIDTVKAISLVSDAKTALTFNNIGFSADDYRRYKSSGLKEAEWARKEQRSPLLGGLIAVLPIGSGLFYTHNIGPAMFITLAKAGSVVGMIPFNGKGGEDRNISWLFPATLICATIADIAGSVYSGYSYNDKLARLETGSPAVSVDINRKNTSITVSMDF
jgi:hypothetical protein